MLILRVIPILILILILLPILAFIHGFEGYRIIWPRVFVALPDLAHDGLVRFGPLLP